MASESITQTFVASCKNCAVLDSVTSSERERREEEELEKGELGSERVTGMECFMH